MQRRNLQFVLSIVLAVVCWLSMGPSPAIALSPIAAVGGKPLFSFSGKRPTNLGVVEGKLLPCPQTPNCVNSQAPDFDGEHAIAPLSLTASPSEAWDALKAAVAAQERTKIIEMSDRYLYAEFTSAIMGFVDDVEFYLDPEAGAIQVRSASRLGESDLGVNRQRIEMIRSALGAVS